MHRSGDEEVPFREPRDRRAAHRWTRAVWALSSTLVALGCSWVMSGPATAGSERREEQPPTPPTIRAFIDPAAPLASEIHNAIAQDPVLKRTVSIVGGTGDFAVRRGPSGAIDIIGSEGVVRNRFSSPTQGDADRVAYTLGLHARQASLTALSAEPSSVYPSDMLRVRVLPWPMPGSCPKTAYEGAVQAVPYVEIPMCNGIQLEIRLTRSPRKPLQLGILLLANDGSIDAWPAAGESVPTLSKKGDVYVEPLGLMVPPLGAPDRLLVFGAHERVKWWRLQGGETRGITDEAPSDDRDSAWTSSFVQLSVTGDPGLWSEADRQNPGACEQTCMTKPN